MISVMFEFLEYSLEHQLANFSECWWDHWILDVIVCNGGGTILGIYTLRWLSLKVTDKSCFGKEKYFEIMLGNWNRTFLFLIHYLKNSFVLPQVNYQQTFFLNLSHWVTKNQDVGKYVRLIGKVYLLNNGQRLYQYTEDDFSVKFWFLTNIFFSKYKFPS